VRRDFVFDGLLPQWPGRTSACLFLLGRGLGQVAFIFGRRRGPAGQVRRGVLLPPGYLGSWPTCRASRPRSSTVVFRGRLTDRSQRVILTLKFFVVFVVSEAFKIAVIFALGVLDRKILLPSIFLGIQHVD